MKLLLAILAGMMVCFGIVPDCGGAVCKGQIGLASELPVIRKAAERNGIEFGSDDWFLLLAIRQAENGRSGCEFGVRHPKAWDTCLDTQAGWAAATIIKHHRRFDSGEVTTAFIYSLADRYCPASCDFEGNNNWKKNVRFWFVKFREINPGLLF